MFSYSSSNTFIILREYIIVELYSSRGGWMIYHDIYEVYKSNTLICRCNIVVLNTIASCLHNMYWNRFHSVLRHCLLMRVSRSAVT